MKAEPLKHLLEQQSTNWTLKSLVISCLMHLLIFYKCREICRKSATEVDKFTLFSWPFIYPSNLQKFKPSHSTTTSKLAIRECSDLLQMQAQT